MSFHLFIKLKHDVKDESEIKLAEMELKGLSTLDFKPIKNAADLLSISPFVDLLGCRFQDWLLRLPYLGNIHGFYTVTSEIPEINFLVRRLAYFKEVYLVWSNIDEQRVLEVLGLNKAPSGERVQINDITLLFRSGNSRALRFLCHQWIMECSYYAATLKDGIEDNLRKLLFHLNWGVHRNPSLGAKGFIEDYVDGHSVGKSAESKYFTHGIHPYHGKFFARLVRSLINYMGLNGRSKILDPFCGSGTTMLEASLLGIPSCGIDINPLACAISRAKIAALKLDLEELKEGFSKVMARFKKKKYGQLLIVEDPEDLRPWTSEEVSTVCLSASLEGRGRVRRPRNEVKAFKVEFDRLIKQITVFKLLREILKIELGEVEVLKGDVRELNINERFDALITSPPYITTVNYVKEHENSMLNLGLTDKNELQELMVKTIGIPGKMGITNVSEDFRDLLVDLPVNSRRMVALYISEIYDAFSSIKEYLKENAKFAVVIGKDHRVSGHKIPTSKIVRNVLSKLDFKIEKSITLKFPGLSVFRRVDWTEEVFIGRV